MSSDASGFLRRYPEFSVSCGDVTLMVGTVDHAIALARIAFDGLFPDGSPTIGEWYDVENPQRNARSVMEYHFKAWDGLDGASVRMPLMVMYEDRVVGTQSLSGVGVPYSVSRELGTGSWLDPRYRGRGIGKKARHAVLHAAFAGFSAETVISSALTTNPASNRVSLACGYQPDGVEVQVVHGKRDELVRYRISRSRWETFNKPHVTMRGHERIANDLGAIRE